MAGALSEHVERIRIERVGIERVGIDRSQQEGLGCGVGRRAVVRQGQQAQYRALIRHLTSCLLEQCHGSQRLSLLEQPLGGAVQVVGIRFHAAHSTNEMRRR